MSSSASRKRCVLITGASRGIGKAAAQSLINNGHCVVGMARSTETMPIGTIGINIDLSDLQALASLLKNLLEKYPIDAVVCNAGIGDIGALENFSIEQITASLSFNLISPLAVARLCMPTLRSRQRSDLVFVGSESAIRGQRFGSVYSAAKFGLRGAAQALRHECSAANCHVGIVNPGMVRTGFFDNLDFGPGPECHHALSVQDVATAIVSMIEAPDHAIIDEITISPRQHVVKRKPKHSGQ